MRLKITTNIEDEYILFTVKSTLLIENITSLETLLKKYIDKKKHILIDLSEITFIDSSSLGILMVFNIELEKNNKYLSLIIANSDIINMLKYTGVDKQIRIFDDITSAITGLGLSK